MRTVRVRTLCPLNMLIPEKLAISILGTGLPTSIQWEFGSQLTWNLSTNSNLTMFGPEQGLSPRPRPLLILQSQFKCLDLKFKVNMISTSLKMEDLWLLFLSKINTLTMI